MNATGYREESASTLWRYEKCWIMPTIFLKVHLFYFLLKSERCKTSFLTSHTSEEYQFKKLATWTSCWLNRLMCESQSFRETVSGDQICTFRKCPHQSWESYTAGLTWVAPGGRWAVFRTYLSLPSLLFPSPPPPEHPLHLTRIQICVSLQTAFWKVTVAIVTALSTPWVLR